MQAQGSTLCLHSPCTAAFYNECFEPLQGRELRLFNHSTEAILKFFVVTEFHVSASVGLFIGEHLGVNMNLKDY